MASRRLPDLESARLPASQIASYGRHAAASSGRRAVVDFAPVERNLESLARSVTGSRVVVAASVGLVLLANALALTGGRLPVLGPAAGFFFLVVQPTYLLFTTAIWRSSAALERVGYSLTATLLALMLGGLAMNAILPALGVARPLNTVPVVILGDVMTAALFMVRRRFPALLDWRACFAAIAPLDSRLITVSLVCVALAVTGANRLNNSAGDQVSMTGLAGVIVILIVLAWKHRRVSDEVIGVTLYLVSAALLLMNSLRGWFVTGHDIQTEYRVFQLTQEHGRWSMSFMHSAYNACLSITILPTEISRLVNVYDPYIYKLFFQLLFALCPVLLYAICRRFAPKLISLLAVIYFIGFPTFSGDMSFLNRQEVAFLFVCVGVLAITNVWWAQKWRRVALCVAAAGIELSHYATMYQFIGMIVVGWLAASLWRLCGRLARARRRGKMPELLPTASRTVGLGSVLIVGAMLPLWGGLATHTAGPVLTDAKAAVTQLLDNSSVATPYSLLSHATLSQQQLLDNYRRSALKVSVPAAGSFYLPTTAVEAYPTPLVTPPVMPLTRLGHLLSDIGVPVKSLNTDVRQSSAKDEQLFVVIGFAALLAVPRLRRRVSQELVFLGIGVIFMVGIFTVFPNLSADYGVLRAFLMALIIAGPVLVVGSIALLSPFGRAWALGLASVLCLAIFASTTGFLPQLTGGYAAQLGLNNSGQYYDEFYTHAQEVAAVNWLAGKPGVLPYGLQAPLGENTADRFAFNTPGQVDGSQYVYDVYPVLIQRQSWVLLSYSIVTTGRAPLSTDGQVITYKYPIGLLGNNKNLVYNNGGAEIFK